MEDIEYVAQFAAVIRKSLASGGNIEVVGWDVLAGAIERVCETAKLAREPGDMKF